MAKSLAVFTTSDSYPVRAILSEENGLTEGMKMFIKHNEVELGMIVNVIPNVNEPFAWAKVTKVTDRTFTAVRPHMKRDYKNDPFDNNGYPYVGLEIFDICRDETPIEVEDR